MLTRRHTRLARHLHFMCGGATQDSCAGLWIHVMFRPKPHVERSLPLPPPPAHRQHLCAHMLPTYTRLQPPLLRPTLSHKHPHSLSLSVSVTHTLSHIFLTHVCQVYTQPRLSATTRLLLRRCVCVSGWCLCCGRTWRSLWMLPSCLSHRWVL